MGSLPDTIEMVLYFSSKSTLKVTDMKLVIVEQQIVKHYKHNNLVIHVLNETH